MQTLLRTCVRRGVHFGIWFTVFTFLAISLPAQERAERVTAEIDDTERTTIQGSQPPMARPENDAGRMAVGTKLEGISIVLSRTVTQEADLHALIATQQDPTSPSYHKWLTPEEFAARFGVADADIAKIQSWLEKHGFTVDSITRSKNRIIFSGTVEQVEAAFGTELHYYKVNGEAHFAPSRDISVPAAVSSVVQTVTNLSTFRPKPHVRFKSPQPAVSPNFTSGQSGNHFLTPKDVATIYDINPAYNAGYAGTGQAIAVVGQSSILLSDIEHFQTAAGFTPVKDPTLVLVPGSGTATVRTGDEGESDLDLEYSSTIANGATIYFVYVGNNASYNVFDAIQYAVDNKTAPVISVSYGLCEAALGQTGYSSLNLFLAQAATQGQSVIAASGDSGSTDCYGVTGLTTAQQEALGVDFPASSQYVTGMGGSEFLAPDVAASNTTYWQAGSSSDVISSALSYIPEQVWNDDSSQAGLSSGGGGVSVLTARPSWQTGVTGIPSGNFRLVPDISLSSSPNNAGYLYCSSDSTTRVTGSCANGFRDSNNTNLTVAGGTSFAAPIFAGMLAIINGKLNSTGQGVVNPTLYALAANSTTYASAFHDITSGGNQCTAGTTYCSTAGTSEYPATTGFDQASGLGSIDFFNLLTAWPGSSTVLAPSKTTLSAATVTPAAGANDAITITVASGSSSSTATPTGTLTIAVDGTTQTSSLALANGAAVYTFSSTTTGSHTITATYSGDSVYASSSSSLTVTVAAASPVASKTTLSAATATPAAGANDAITITVASGSSSSTATPTGTLTIAVDGTTQTSSLALVNGAAVYTFSSTTTGSHTITATYSGDSVYASSSSSLTVTVAANKAFKLAATSVTVSAGNAGTSTVTVTPQNGYTGTVAWTISSSPLLLNGCFVLPNTTVSGTSAVAATLTLYTIASSCTNSAVVLASSRRDILLGGVPIASRDELLLFSPLHATQASMAIAGLLIVGLLGRRSRRLATLAGICTLAVVGLAASGCAGGLSAAPSSSTPSAAKGTYTITIVGADTASSAITASTTMTLTIN